MREIEHTTELSSLLHHTERYRLGLKAARLPLEPTRCATCQWLAVTDGRCSKCGTRERNES